MKPFSLDPKMLTMRGVFYPTGYVMAMVPDRIGAMQVARELETGYTRSAEIELVEPSNVINVIGPTAGTSDEPLPSVGTEGATVRQFVDLAQQGQYGLLIPVANDKEADRVMEVLHSARFSYAQRYHMLAIEDIT